MYDRLAAGLDVTAIVSSVSGPGPVQSQFSGKWTLLKLWHYESLRGAFFTDYD